MKIAIMQPYFFPYIGYYQLINLVDTFYIFDDVSYIKKGWINRNKLLLNNNEYLFTIPLENASQNRNINEHIVSEQFEQWYVKFLKTLEMNYGKYKNYDEVINIIKKTFVSNNISDISENSLKLVCEYLGITTKFERTSVFKYNNQLNGTHRIIDICKRSKATEYINSIGGRNLYDHENFSHDNIKLSFLECKEPLGYLSVVQLLMKHGRDTRQFLHKYELIK